ncbi:MAG TPA: glycerophosphoryl diester phosphodiesterase membrane domain-containing protein [Sphingomicrobium sp.]|nr:glycerophosphoryl diester phosphodiesterase membrane domain-containing protein [Sphingomicrobium sp.]
MARLSISQAWVETRERIRRDGNLYLSVALALLVLPHTLAGLIAPDGRVGAGSGAGTPLLMLAVGLISLIGQIALVRLASGPSASVGEAIGHGARRLLPTLAALLMFGLLIILLVVPVIMVMIAAGAIDPNAATPSGARAGSFGLALLLLLLVAIALSVRLMLILPVASAERLGPVQILRRSWRLTAGHYGRLLGLLLLLVIAAILLVLVAAILGGIGARMAGDMEPMSLSALIAAAFSALAQAAFTILSSVMLARVYLQLAGGSGAEASVPSSGT